MKLFFAFGASIALAMGCGNGDDKSDGGGDSSVITDATADAGGDANIACSSTSDTVTVRYQYAGETVTHSVCAPLLFLRDRYSRPADGGACDLVDTEAYGFINAFPSFGTEMLQQGEVFKSAGQITVGLSLADDVYCPFDAGQCKNLLNLSCSLDVTTAGAFGAPVAASLAQPCTLQGNTVTVNVTGWDLQGTLAAYTQFADAGASDAECP